MTNNKQVLHYIFSTHIVCQTPVTPAITTTPPYTTFPLTAKDFSLITQHLRQLNIEELRSLGVELGVCYSRLKNTSQESLLYDMVNAWLRRDDEVIKCSGEPSWKTLCKALEAKGHNGIASDIRKNSRGIPDVTFTY